MKVIWPDKFKVKAEKIGQDKWKLNYIERIENAPKGSLEDTITILKNVNKTFGGGKWKIRHLKDAISISMEGNREQIYDFIVSEFLPQSTLGKKTLAEVFIGLGASAGLMKPDPDVLKQLKQIGGLLEDLPQPGITGELKGESRVPK